MTSTRKTCKQLVHKELRDRIEALKILWAARCVGETYYDVVKDIYERQEALREKYPKKPRKGSEARAEYDDEQATIDAEVENLSEDCEFLYEHFQYAEDHGGSRAFDEFGYGLSYTEYSREYKYGGFLCWLLSGGGPSDEFQFYIAPDYSLIRVEYRYKDWFDGAAVVLTGDDEELLEEIFNDFKECGTVEYIMNEWRKTEIPEGQHNDR